MSELTRDPSITADELNDALGATPQPYQDVEFHDDITQLVHTLSVVVPATPAEAMTNAKALTDNNVFVGVGMCLATVRGREFEVPALWPDATTAWENAATRHFETNPNRIPRGAVVYWLNGRHGHVALSVGGGLCRTTDYRRTGFVDLAPISALDSWCGGRLVGWGETLNGIDVWPSPNKPDPKPAPKPWGLEEKHKLVASALKHAKENHVSERRIDGLTTWLHHIEDRLGQKDQK